MKSVEELRKEIFPNDDSLQNWSVISQIGSTLNDEQLAKLTIRFNELLLPFPHTGLMALNRFVGELLVDEEIIKKHRYMKDMLEALTNMSFILSKFGNATVCDDNKTKSRDIKLGRLKDNNMNNPVGVISDNFFWRISFDKLQENVSYERYFGDFAWLIPNTGYKLSIDHKIKQNNTFNTREESIFLYAAEERAARIPEIKNFHQGFRLQHIILEKTMNLKTNKHKIFWNGNKPNAVDNTKPTKNLVSIINTITADCVNNAKMRSNI
jgi:hypothetical protein